MMLSRTPMRQSVLTFRHLLCPSSGYNVNPGLQNEVTYTLLTVIFGAYLRVFVALRDG